MSSISIFVCESQPIVIEGLRKVLAETTDLVYAGAVSRPADALDAIQRILRAAPRPETIREPLKILLINLIEDRHHGLLNDFVLHGSDAQRSLPSIGFRYIGSL